MEPTSKNPSTGSITFDGRHRELVTALLGAWIVAGAALDGWAHTTRANLDPFFTPWHAVLYSGFASLALWTLFMRRAGATSNSAGSRLTVIGLWIFAAGGVGDLVWHQVFGVERSVAAVTSPSHIALLLGAALFLSAPARARWHRADARVGWTDLLPILLSVAGLVILFELALFFASPFVPRTYGGLLPMDSRFTFDVQRDVVVGVLAGNAILFVPVIALATRWRMPRGSLLALLLLAAFPMVAIGGFRSSIGLWTAALGGLFVEVLREMMRPEPDSSTVATFAAVASFGFWLVYLSLIGFVGDVAIDPEVVVGAPIWAAGTSWLVARTFARPRDAAGAHGGNR